MGDPDYRSFRCLQAGDRLLPWLRVRSTEKHISLQFKFSCSMRHALGVFDFKSNARLRNFDRSAGSSFLPKQVRPANCFPGDPVSMDRASVSTIVDTVPPVPVLIALALVLAD
jgi:hypothetical protein